MIRYVLILVIALGLIQESSGSLEARDVAVRVFAGQTITKAVIESDGSGSLIISQSGETIAELLPDESAVVEVWQGLLRVRWSRGSAPVSQVSIESSRPINVTPDGREGRLFRGTFHASLDDTRSPELLLVNRVDIEDYVASVLPAEYPFTEIEGAKAQAIVIRSYAESLDGSKTAAYALRDDIGSQVYRGVETETEFSRSVANLTAGSVMLYDGEVVEAVYSSHCGGHSANNEDIWGSTPIPYLRGRKDPFDGDAPGAEWESEASIKSVHEGLSRTLGKRVKGVNVAERGKGDHVRMVRIDVDEGPDESLSGERFRSMLNGALGRPLILSSKFEIRKGSGEYRFEGRGTGHGVGFCQWGAAEQARRGRDYKDILTFYYKGVDISEAEPEILAVRNVKEAKAGLQEASTPVTETEPEARSRRPGW